MTFLLMMLMIDNYMLVNFIYMWRLSFPYIRRRVSCSTYELFLFLLITRLFLLSCWVSCSTYEFSYSSPNMELKSSILNKRSDCVIQFPQPHLMIIYYKVWPSLQYSYMLVLIHLDAQGSLSCYIILTVGL